MQKTRILVLQATVQPHDTRKHMCGSLGWKSNIIPLRNSTTLLRCSAVLPLRVGLICAM